MLCTNKIRVIYFCPNCVSFLPENVNFFILGKGSCPPAPAPACAPMGMAHLYFMLRSISVVRNAL